MFSETHMDWAHPPITKVRLEFFRMKRSQNLLFLKSDLLFQDTLHPSSHIENWLGIIHNLNYYTLEKVIPSNYILGAFHYLFRTFFERFDEIPEFVPL